MVNESERDGIRVAVTNWVAGKADIGRYVYDRCSEYVGAGHPDYCAELIGIACTEARASQSMESAPSAAPNTARDEICPHYLQDLGGNNVCLCAGKLPPVA